MKKIISILLILLSVRSFSQTICATPFPFQNLDLRQIYCALKSGSGGTSTVTVSNPSVTVLNPSVTILNPVTTVTVTGNVGGYTDKQTFTVNATSNYTVGDCVGGIIPIASLKRNGINNFIIYEVTMFDENGGSPNLNIDFISNIYYTGGAVDHVQTDLTGNTTRYVGSVQISSSDWIQTGTITRASIKYVGIICTGLELIAVITTGSAVNYGSGGLTMKLGVLQD